jgi:hypothetical protein
MNYKAADIGAEVKKITNSLDAKRAGGHRPARLAAADKTVVRVCGQ